MFDLAALKPEHFTDLIGAEFPLVDTDFSLELVSVKRLNCPSPRAEPFSLTLRAPIGTRGGQGIYALRHPQLGILEIFLVPMPPVDGQPQFEAVFN